MNDKKCRTGIFSKFNMPVRLLLFLFLAVIFIKIFVLGFYRVMSSSMFPTLEKGDNVLILKNQILSLMNIGKKDVIVFKNPEGRNTLVKRVWGEPGDTIKCRSGSISINGRSIPRDKMGIECKGTMQLIIPEGGDRINLKETVLPFFKNIIRMKGKNVSIKNGIVFIDGLARNEMLIEEDCYFVIGDNINNSRDSRSFGLLSADMIIGKPFFVYWPEKYERLFHWIK